MGVRSVAATAKGKLVKEIVGHFHLAKVKEGSAGNIRVDESGFAESPQQRRNAWQVLEALIETHFPVGQGFAEPCDRS